MDPRDEALLHDLLDDRLDAASTAAVRARLEAEPELRESWEELGRIRDLVRGPAVHRAPPDFLTQVRTRIARTAEADGLPAASTAGSGAASSTHAPRGVRLALPHRLALVASGLAALLLVALGVRWMVPAAAPAPEDLLLVESARAPGRTEAPGDLREAAAPEDADDDTAGVPGVRAPADPAAPRPAPGPARTSARGSPVAAPSAPRPPAAGFAPGDQVPPNLRSPMDGAEDLGRLPAAPRRAREEKAAGGGPRGPDTPPAPVAVTWVLEAEDLASGHARLALLVGGIQVGHWGEEAKSALAPLRAVRTDDEVLGSVLLHLSADEAASLCETAADGKPADGSGSDRDEGDEAAEAPPAPGEPAAGERYPAAPAGKARKDDATRVGDTHVRILLVRAAARR